MGATKSAPKRDNGERGSSMKGDRHRVSVDPEYCKAIGLAAYCFSMLEWNAVWCCEKIRPGSIPSLSRDTAGKVASTLVRLADTLPTSAAHREECRSAAAEFQRIIQTRNDFLHAPPGTAPNGDQVFYRKGRIITIADLEDAADEFTACSIRLNSLLHGPLSA
jgi:hypothetical protein